MTQEEMAIKIAGAIVVLGIIYYIYMLRDKRRRAAIAAHDDIRKMINDLRRSAEYMDSRIQWTFQEGGDYESLIRVNQMLAKLQEKGDWNIAAFKEKHNDEWNDVQNSLSEWVKKKPNYDTKDDFLRDVKRLEDIIQRW